jgi:hypothetical protein
MTLLETADTLRERIKTVKTLEAKENIAEIASEKARHLNELREALTLHRERGRVLGLRKDAIAWPNIATDVLDAFEAVLAPAHDPSEPTVEAAYKVLVQTITPVAADAKAIVEPLIEEERAMLTKIDRSELEAWKTMHADPAAIDAAIAELERLLKMPKKEWLKLSPPGLEKTLKAKAKVLRIVDKIMAYEMPAEVQTFLHHAKEGGAAVEHFSETVRSWLASRKQLARIRIVFK